MSKAASKKAAPAKKAASKRAASKRAEAPEEKRETLAVVSEEIDRHDMAVVERAKANLMADLRTKMREADWTEHEVEDVTLSVDDDPGKGGVVFKAEAVRRKRAEGQAGRARE